MADDCRCAVCGICKHDHGGWKHEWTPKPINVNDHCRLCGTEWVYDQPVCVNNDCPSHDWTCPTGCATKRLEKHPRWKDYRFPMWRCSNCKEWTDIDWYNRQGRND
jgi:hypothetical protein